MLDDALFPRITFGGRDIENHLLEPGGWGLPMMDNQHTHIFLRARVHERNGVNLITIGGQPIDIHLELTIGKVASVFDGQMSHRFIFGSQNRIGKRKTGINQFCGMQHIGGHRES